MAMNMGINKMEQQIEKIFEYLEGCRGTAFSQTKITVQKDELFDKLDELKLRLPEEFKRCQKVLQNRDAILADAEDKANQIIEEACRRADQLVEESAIMQRAYDEANEIRKEALQYAEDQHKEADDYARDVVEDAQRESLYRREEAYAYANGMLEEIEHVMAEASAGIKTQSEYMANSLRQNLSALSDSRKELLQRINEFRDAIDENEDDEEEDEEEDEEASFDDEDYEEDDEDEDEDNNR